MVIYSLFSGSALSISILITSRILHPQSLLSPSAIFIVTPLKEQEQRCTLVYTQDSSWFVKMSCLQPCRLVPEAPDSSAQLPYHKFVKTWTGFYDPLSFCIKWGIFHPFHSWHWVICKIDGSNIEIEGS